MPETTSLTAVPKTVPAPGLTVRELAKILRVSPDRIRGWIKSGELGAINTSMAHCRKPRFVVLPHHLVEFERSRAASPSPKPQRRRHRQAQAIDFYPD